MLEGMLLGLPVATLDFCNCPHYAQARVANHRARTYRSDAGRVADPPEAKMLFQDTTLHDALECATPAAPRLLSLAAEMIAHGWKARRSGQSLCLPARVLDTNSASCAVVENRFRLVLLHPDHAQFQEKNQLAALEVEVGHLRRYAAGLEQRLREAGMDAKGCFAVHAARGSCRRRGKRRSSASNTSTRRGLCEGRRNNWPRGMSPWEQAL